MTTFISKQTISRLLKDVSQILKNPLTENGIYYIHDDTDMMKGYALLIGGKDTPYFGGYYFFELTYPSDYPHSPPNVKYCTNGNNVRFNPNLYVCGKVCISLLNTWRGEQWSSCQTITSVLLTLCTILCKNPLLNEPGVTMGHQDLINYNEIIEYSNIDVAICDIIEKKEGVYLPFFEKFYPFIKENYLKNHEELIKFAEYKKEKYGGKVKEVNTTFYFLKVNIDYNKVIQRMKTYFCE